MGPAVDQPMEQGVPFWPVDAAVSARLVDGITIGEFVLIGLILCLVFGMMAVFCVRYRNGSPVERSADKEDKSWRIEIGWTSATLAAFFVLFVLGARAYLYMYRPPARTDLELYVVAKQWMWKIQHPGGQREINALHVPVNRSIRVVLASQDVIHSFFIPAFRIKHDVVPGQLEAFWFQPTRVGSYPLECSEFCGVDHAHMTGTVTVMTQAAYAHWLETQGVTESLAAQGAALFRRYGCSGCHAAASTVHTPLLDGLYGSIVHLADGRSVRADERYIRDCILVPQSQRVAGYPPVMPSFAGQLGEEDLIALIAYVKSLATGSTP